MYLVKTCPFCGGRPYLESSHRAFIGGESTKVAFVRCMQCNARSGRIRLSDYGCTSYCESACRQAVEDWNKRSQSEETVMIYSRSERKHHDSDSAGSV